MIPRASIVVPVADTGQDAVLGVRRILEAVRLPCEVLVVHDAGAQRTAELLAALAAADERVRPVASPAASSSARAIRAGFDAASADVVVVTSADGSDDPDQIDDLVRLVERGVVIAAASRYCAGGRQVGGPLVKSSLARMAGRTLHVLAGVSTTDALNSFKAYSRSFVRDAAIESEHGFELGLELVAKARRRRLPIAELPTIWLDRSSSDPVVHARAIPRYLRWYAYAFGPRLDATATAAPVVRPTFG